MALFTRSTFASTTIYTASATAAYVKAIIAYPGDLSTVSAFVQLYNAAGAEPGTTVPDAVFPIRPAGGTALSSRRRPAKFIFPNGGIQFDTALTLTVTSTGTGSVAPQNASAPGRVEIHYAPIL